MKSSVTSSVDVGKDASSGATSLSATTDAQIKATAPTLSMRR
ncbi:hypothetical protein [Streptomyces paradoxus]